MPQLKQSISTFLQQYDFKLEDKLFTVSIIFFLFFSIINIFKPFSSDESWFIIEAHKFVRTGQLDSQAFIHPPLYTIIIGSIFKIFNTPISIKAFGILCGTSIITLMYYLGRFIDGGFKISSMACLLLALNPAFIQGCLLIDIDNTLITLLLIGVTIAYLNRNHFALILSLVLLLWSKLTASVPILFTFTLIEIYGKISNKSDKTFSLFKSISIAVFIFIFSFLAYCKLDFSYFLKPFHYLYSSLVLKGSSNYSVSQQIFQFILWFQITFCGLWIMAIFVSFREKFEKTKIIPLITIILIVGYFFVGGTPFGFPKYQIPALPFMAYIISQSLLKKNIEFGNIRIKTIILMIVATIFILITGDPLLTLRFSLREALAYGYETHKLLILLIFQACVPLFLLTGFFIYYHKKKIPIVKTLVKTLFMVTICQFISLNILQTKNHNVLYTYGSTGLSQTTTFIKPFIKNGKTALPLEIYSHLLISGYKLKKTDNKFWSDKTNIVNAIKDPKYRIISYNIASNTISQLRILLDKDIEAEFKKNKWQKNEIGSYTIWHKGN